MKRRKNMFLGVMVMLFFVFAASYQGLAGEKPTFLELKTLQEKKISLVLEDVNATTEIIIRNEKGQPLLSEQVRKTDTFAKVFNLEKLSAGLYDLIISDAQKDIVQPFEIRAGIVLMDETRRKEYFAPVIGVKSKMLDISLFNRGLANVELTIMDKEHKVLFADIFKGVLRIERRYNMKNLRRGTYTVKIATAYKTYYHQVSL